MRSDLVKVAVAICFQLLCSGSKGARMLGFGEVLRRVAASLARRTGRRFREASGERSRRRSPIQKTHRQLSARAIKLDIRGAMSGPTHVP